MSARDIYAAYGVSRSIDLGSSAPIRRDIGSLSGGIFLKVTPIA